MTQQSSIFLQLPDLRFATSLGPIQAYITQSSRRQCCLDTKFHRHSWYEIAWLTGGTSRYFVDFQEFEVAENSLVFISPGQMHGWFNPHEKATITVIGFRPELFALDILDVQKTLIDLPFFIEDAAPVYQAVPHLQPLFEQFFSTTLERVKKQPDQRETLVRAYLNLILVEAQNMLATYDVPSLAPTAPHRLTRRFRLDVEQMYMKRQQVQDYAHNLGVTANHLIETVRETTGLTPKRIMQERLLLEAKRLLAHTSLSTAEVGHELSFSNASQFGRWFRTNAGIAPGRFRQQVIGDI